MEAERPTEAAKEIKALVQTLAAFDLGKRVTHRSKRQTARVRPERMPNSP